MLAEAQTVNGTPTLVYVLISVVGSGTLVPLLYGAWTRWRDKPQKIIHAKQQREEMAASAAREAVSATKGAINVLRQQLQDGRAEIRECHDEVKELRKDRADDREEIKALRRRIRELRGEHVPPDER